MLRVTCQPLKNIKKSFRKAKYKSNDNNKYYESTTELFKKNCLIQSCYVKFWDIFILACLVLVFIDATLTKSEDHKFYDCQNQRIIVKQYFYNFIES